MASQPAAAPPRTLRDYLMATFDWRSCIVLPEVQGSFQLDPEWIQMLPTFYGKSDENPYLHIYEFIDLCKIIGINQVNQEVVRLKLFPISLKDKAKSWLYSLPPESIHSWEQLAQKFLEKYFPRHKIIQLRREIMNFAQGKQEQFHKAWDRFEKLLYKCPDHGVSDSMQVYCFYEGLTLTDKRMVDSTCGGTLMNKTWQEGFDLFDSLANDQRWGNEGTSKTGVDDVDYSTGLVDKISVLENKLESLMRDHGIPPSSQQVCAKCSDPIHPRELYPYSASFPEFNQEQNDPYSNNAYNLGWKNPLTFSLNQQKASHSPLEDLCAQVEQTTQQIQNTVRASISKFPSQPERKFESKTISDSNLHSFRYEEIREATNGFKEELGQGGFRVI